jgi:2'-5' RNA ligase
VAVAVTDERARLFVAVVPPPAVLDRLAREVGRPALPGIRYTRPDQWHVTLRFLGMAVLAEAVEALNALRAATATAHVGPAVVRLGPGVVCLAVDGLGALATAVTDATAGVGRPPGRRSFRGHLTLARLAGGDGRRAAGSLVGAPFAATFGVTEVHLVRSRTEPTGAVYDTVATRSLPAGGGGTGSSPVASCPRAMGH